MRLPGSGEIQLTNVTQLMATAMVRLARGVDRQDLLKELARSLSSVFAADLVSLFESRRGTWQVVVHWGVEHLLPFDLLSEALDTGMPRVAGRWCAAPLPENQQAAQVLVLHGDFKETRDLLEEVSQVAAWLQALQTVLDTQYTVNRRIEQLEAMLGIAAQWGQTLEMDQLLQQIAEASTRLMDAERASIFLWDRPNKILVGRPALGVEGGELRIADDTGVVGKVVHTGEPHRVNTDADRAPIDRRVDRELGFKTHTLLCVPLRGRNDRLLGAFELVNKRSGDFSDADEVVLRDLAAHAAVALETTQQYEQLLRSRNEMAEQAAAGVELIGECPAIEALRSTIQRVANTDLAVLVLGENGTGKEVVSRSIHYMSRRRNEPFIALNCASLTETLLESELFGHEKGAFTDARETRSGKFEAASGGTLFLDEIGDMSAGGQAKLLRVLEQKVVVRVGGTQPISIDTRVVAATNQNLADLVREKRFRQDLFFRLNVVTLELPPLRDRADDVVLLAERFLRDFCRRAGRRPPRFTAAARKRLTAHSWPGNVRELRNLMERIAYLSTDEKIDADELALVRLRDGQPDDLLAGDLPLTEATRKFQVDYIQRQIQRTGGNMTDAADRLGLHRANLYRKMRQLGLSE